MIRLVLASAAALFAVHLATAREAHPVGIRPVVDTPTPSPFQTHHLRDLAHRGAFVDYVPEPGQGSRHVTDAGAVWWGWGPSGAGPRPVIVLFHGSGRTGESMVDMWRETAEREGLVLVAPDFEGVDGWDRSLPDPNHLLAVLDDAVGTYAIDAARVAFFGHSRGGMAAQLLANRLDGPWRAVAVHAGTVPAEAMRPVAEGPPIRHYLGALDQTFPYDEAVAAGRGIAGRGHAYDLVRMERRTHWLYDRGEDIAYVAWRWLDGVLND